MSPIGRYKGDRACKMKGIARSNDKSTATSPRLMGNDENDEK
jgi:hypothetical protein